MKLPFIITTALKFLTGMPWGEVTGLFKRVQLNVDGVDTRQMTGRAKAELVVNLVLPQVPIEYRDIAKQVVQILIEVYLILKRRPQ